LQYFLFEFSSAVFTYSFQTVRGRTLL
jgi:hypothetical protein